MVVETICVDEIVYIRHEEESPWLSHMNSNFKDWLEFDESPKMRGQPERKEIDQEVWCYQSKRINSQWFRKEVKTLKGCSESSKMITENVH